MASKRSQELSFAGKYRNTRVVLISYVNYIIGIYGNIGRMVQLSVTAALPSKFPLEFSLFCKDLDTVVVAICYINTAIAMDRYTPRI